MARQKHGHLSSIEMSKFLILLLLLAGCVAERFNGAVGLTESAAIQRLGKPDRTEYSHNGSKVLIYYIEDSNDDSDEVDCTHNSEFADKIVCAAILGTAQMAATATKSTLVTPPARYVFVGVDGRINGWEERGSRLR